MHGRSGCSSWIWRTSSRPWMPGMRTSHSTRSSGSAETIAIASLASRAQLTRWPTRARILSRARRYSSSSSITRTWESRRAASPAGGSRAHSTRGARSRQRAIGRFEAFFAGSGARRLKAAFLFADDLRMRSELATREGVVRPENARGVVLLVDDEPLLLKALERILRPEGYEVLTALSLEAARPLLLDASPDVVLVDLF